MTDLMESPTATVDRINDGLGDRWEFEGFGVRLDVFPQPIEPGKLRFTFPVEVAVPTRHDDPVRLYREGERYREATAGKNARLGDSLTVEWDIDV